MNSTSARKSGISRILMNGVAAIALVAPAAAFAQDAPASSTEEDIASGNAILVTATKREQTLQEIPVAVSVATAETLERENIRDLRDLQTVVPSLRSFTTVPVYRQLVVRSRNKVHIAAMGIGMGLGWGLRGKKGKEILAQEQRNKVHRSQEGAGRQRSATQRSGVYWGVGAAQCSSH